jgi:hypothetical protein
VEGVLGVVRVTALYYKRHQLLERKREAGYETELMQQMQRMQRMQQMQQMQRVQHMQQMQHASYQCAYA